MFKIYIRWIKSHDDAGGDIEVRCNDVIVWSRPVGNNDRVYGYCMAIVDWFRVQGEDIEMPKCLQGHLGPDRNRED